MNILIFTNHFYPEQFKVNDVAFYLAEKGERVTVITGIPNYPKGQFFDGYGIFRKNRETIKGVEVIRLPLIPRGKGGGIRLAFNYISYLISMLFYLPVLCRRKWDRVFVHETSPIFIGIPAVLISKIQHIPLFFWVLDLWPESVTAASGFRNSAMLNLLDRLVRWIYQNSDRILISSRRFEYSILQKGNFKDKLYYLPNWAEGLFEKNEKSTLPIPLPEGFRIIYAGNIGEAQDLENVVKAAQETRKYSDIHWILIGDGRKKTWVEEYIRTHGLQDNVHLPGRFDISKMPSFFSKADLMLLSLKDEPIFALTVPARLQAYMACGKPVLGMVNGEAADLIHESGCGVVANSGDWKMLAKLVLEMYNQKDTLEEKGHDGARYYNSNFRRLILLDRLYLLLSD